MLINFTGSSALLKPLEKLQPNPPISPVEYINVLNSLINHINGVAILTDSDFVANDAILVENMSVLSTDIQSITKSFELIDIFENTLGPLFIATNTRYGFDREYSSDGLNLHRNVILIHQGLIDYTYSEQWLLDASNILEEKLFQTSQYFPGSVAAPANANSIENAKVRCSYLLASGTQPHANIGNPNVVRPTGCYLAPGSIAEITVPASLVAKGIKIRVGAHYWNLDNKSKYERLDRVSITYDVNQLNTKIANPLGGGIYLEIPLGVDEGVLDITLKNVVRSPFYSKKTFFETSISDWLAVERNHTAPWADFETDKFMMQVPTSWIYQFDDPKTLLEEWDESMDVVSDLLGRPRIVDRHKNYIQFDVVFRGSAYFPGYPNSNTNFDPHAATDGLPKDDILKGPQYNQAIHFHELGHEVAISKFVGEVEALVNFLYVAVLNRGFGYSLDEAFQKSFTSPTTKENSVKNRLVADTFHEGLPRNICNCENDEVRYQKRGYAHYADIVELFGWEALDKFFKAESDAADMGTPFPVNNQPQDDRIFRLSKAAGVDLRPLFHFWGIHPNNQTALAQQMANNNLELPLSIKSKLLQYKELIPSNNQEFIEFGNEQHPDFMNYSGSQFNFGPGWYKVRAETYDETSAIAIEQAFCDIITLYYGGDACDIDTESPSDVTGFVESNQMPNSFDLSWDASTDNVGVTGYGISISGVSGSPFTTTDTSYSFTGLTPETTYIVQVLAYDAEFNESMSTSISVTTPPATDTESPSDVTGFVGSNLMSTSFDLSWDASTDNVGVTGYNVFINGDFIGTTSGLTFSFMNLLPDTGYNIEVVAVDAAGNESTLTSVYVTTLTATDTESPSDVTGFVGSNLMSTSFDLSWDASTDNVGVTGYNVFINGDFIGTTSGLTFSFMNLLPDTGYNIEVVAVDAAGNESTPTSVYVTTLTAQDTEPPTDVTGFVGSNLMSTSFDLSWDASNDNVGVTGYNVFINGDFIGTTSGLTFSFMNLLPDTGYNIEVVAVDAAGNGSTPTSVYVTTPTPNVSVSTSPFCSGGLAVFTISGTPGDMVSYTYTFNDFNGSSNTISNTAEIRPSGTIDVKLRGLISDINLELTNVSSMGVSTSLNGISAIANVNTITIPFLTSNTPISSGENAVFTITGTAGDVVTYSGASSGTATIGAGGTVDITIIGVTVDKTLNLTDVSSGSCGIIELSETATVSVLTAPNTGPSNKITGIKLLNLTSTAFDLLWVAPDNFATTEYRVLVNGVLDGTTTDSSYTITPISIGIAYNVSIIPVDASGNESTPTNLKLIKAELSSN